MNSRKTFIYLFLLLVCVITVSRPLSAHAQSYSSQTPSFRHLDIHDGLSQNTVTSILQDRNGFMWIATKNGLNRYDGRMFKKWNKNNSGLQSNLINALHEDNDGKIWIGTDHGLFVYDPLTELITCPEFSVSDKKDIARAVIRTIFTDPTDGSLCIVPAGLGVYKHDDRTGVMRQQVGMDWYFYPSYATFAGGMVWVASGGQDLFFTNKLGRKLVAFRDSQNQAPFLGVETNMILERGNEVYVGTDRGLFKVNVVTRQTQLLLDSFVRTLAFSLNGETLWVGTQDGLFCMNLSTLSFTHIVHPNMDEPFALSDNAIYALCFDVEGGMWVGSYFGGLNYLPPSNTDFERYYPHLQQQDMGQRVREICQDRYGHIWIGCEDRGLLRFDPDTKATEPVATHLKTENIHGLCVSDEWLYVGAFAGGLERINLRTGAWQTFFADGSPNSLRSNYVFSLCYTRQGELLIGTPNGLVQMDEDRLTFRQVGWMPEVFVYQIVETSDGCLWIATYQEGLYSYDPKARKLTHYVYQDGKEGTLGDSKVISIYEDSHKRLWIMTHEGGIAELQRDRGVFVPLQLNTAENDYIFYKMVEDRQGFLWCSTSNGLCRYNPETRQARFFTIADGLQSDQFNYQSGLIDDRGYLYFGGVNGFVRFRPEFFRNQTVVPQLAFSSIQFLAPGDAGFHLERNINMTEHLELSHRQNSFTISARVLSYVSPRNYSVMYWLDGLEKGWQPADDEQGLITFRNLPPGEYTLHIKGVCHDEALNPKERVLAITITPPWHQSVYAKITYVILALLLGYGMVRLVLKRHRRRMREAQRVLKQKTEQELYNSKIRFFTNITHEIRTPLTLIKSPIEKVLGDNSLSAENLEDLAVVHKNTEKLVALVNQLLDFQKMETNGLDINIEQLNVKNLLVRAIDSFRPSARNLSLQFDAGKTADITAMVDADLFEKILNNIIGNALKYAGTYIKITLTTTADSFVLVEENDGAVVPLKMREEIFKPFVNYAGDETRDVTSTGIGLALARNLAEMHHGTLRMDDDETVNRFILSMPLRQEHALTPLADAHDEKQSAAGHEQADAAPEDKEAEILRQTEHGRSALLFVEDNLELRNFLVRHFSASYEVLAVENGAEAVSLLHKKNVSLVVSDVMMPVMDGIELCRQIKENMEFSHIPVILLTAKTSIQARLEGLRHGADAYIDKPFSMPVLEQTVQTILENHRRLYDSIVARPQIMNSMLCNSDAENEFMQRLGQETNVILEDPEYDVNKLALAMGMSRSSLNRKMKASLNMSPNEYIRLERLRRAAKLLNTGKYRVSEVCYMVGFNTPSYFTKCFQEQYGVLPSDLEHS